MSEQTRPQPPREIDRADVLGELEHRFRSVTDDLPVIGRVLDELVELDILRYRERADDPSKSLRGEVRDCEPGLPAVCYGKDFWIFFRADGGPGYSVYRDVQMVGKPVIGAVPGTPAAEAEKPYSVTLVLPCGHDSAEHGPECPDPCDGVRAREARDPLTMEQRQRLSALLVDGRKADAVALVAAIGMPHDKALKYVESMPEYQTGENHRPVDDVALPPLHVDNEAIVRGEYAETVRQPVPLSEIFPPRVFKADYETNTVQEPPESVSVVVDKHGDHLRRKDDGWIGDGGDGYPKWVKPWERHALPKYAPYREVV